MKKYITIILAFLTIANSSCKKNYLDELKNNPNTPSVASPSLLLSGSLKTTAGIVNGGNFIPYAAYLGYLSRSTGFQVFGNLDQYQITSNDFNSYTPFFLNISNYNAILNSNSGAKYTGIAKVMMVYDFQALVDNYNNIPYSQALKGANNLTPEFDDASKIYDDLLVQIDAAIKILQGATANDLNPGIADIMFGGDMTKWIKFANTIKLRIAIRQSNITAKTASLKAATQATQALGYIDATFSASVNPGYANNDANGGQASPLYINYGYTQSGAGTNGNQQYQANTYGIN
ncbi:SusD/RagB family nutrient-binding outer membrane lipoprotein, partial [Mucilaginibacter sp. 10I4]